MSDNTETVKEYCVDRGYFVSIHRDTNINGCTAIFPSQSIFKDNMVGCTAFYEVNDLGINCYYASDDGDTSQTNLQCPEYSRRILIFSDILAKTLSLNISPKLIVSYDAEGQEITKKGFLGCLAPPAEDKQQELEDYFATIFYRFLSDPDADYSELASRHGVEHGYNLLTLPSLRKEFEQ